MRTALAFALLLATGCSGSAPLSPAAAPEVHLSAEVPFFRAMPFHASSGPGSEITLIALEWTARVTNAGDAPVEITALRTRFVEPVSGHVFDRSFSPADLDAAAARAVAVRTAVQVSGQSSETFAGAAALASRAFDATVTVTCRDAAGVAHTIETTQRVP